jgi:hypothetical protein
MGRKCSCWSGYETLLLSHSSVTGTDLLRLLCMELGQTAPMRRCDNVMLIRQGWQQLDRLWPVLFLHDHDNFLPDYRET